MKNHIRFYQSIPAVALATIVILLVPFVAMQLTNKISWSVSDFITMGVLLFTTGISYVLITWIKSGLAYKAACVLALGATFLMVWANLAVGLIGSGPNIGNLMYVGVPILGLFSIFLLRFTSSGMERSMYVTALSLVLVAVIALLGNMQEYPGSSVKEIIGVNGFFSILFVVSGLLFRYAAKAHHRSVEKSES